MKLLFSTQTTTDIDGIYEYIAMSNPAAARSTVEKIDRAIQVLLQFPKRGRTGRVPGTRELVVAGLPYVVAYAITGATIEVLTVLHGARHWPASFDR